MMGSDVGIFWHGLRCGLWVWQRGESRRGGLWRGASRRGGSWTHDRGKWVLMGGFKEGLGWFPSPVFSPFCLLSPLCSISPVVFDVGFAFGFV